MKVLIKGVPPKGRTYNFTCSYCLSYIEALGTEGDTTVYSDQIIFKCPVCSKDKMVQIHNFKDKQYEYLT